MISLITMGNSRMASYMDRATSLLKMMQNSILEIEKTGKEVDMVSRSLEEWILMMDNGLMIKGTDMEITISTKTSTITRVIGKTTNFQGSVSSNPNTHSALKVSSKETKCMVKGKSYLIRAMC